MYMGKCMYLFCCGCQCLHDLSLKVILLTKPWSEAVLCPAKCDVASPTACRQRSLAAAHVAHGHPRWELFILPAFGLFLPKSGELAELHQTWSRGSIWPNPSAARVAPVLCGCEEAAWMVRSWAVFNCWMLSAWGVMKVSVWVVWSRSECAAPDSLSQGQKRRKGWDGFAFVNACFRMCY